MPGTTEKPTSGQYLTYWITRNETYEGVISDSVDVWLVRPVRKAGAYGGWEWLGPGGLEDRYAQWSLASCLMQCRTYPDDSRQCIKVGE